MTKTRQSSRPSLRLATICIDCADADVMADFYHQLLGLEVALREPGWVLTRDPAGGTGMSFQAEAEYREPVWPEQPGGQDKMLHLDIHVDDLDSAVAHALASGARLADMYKSHSSKSDWRSSGMSTTARSRYVTAEAGSPSFSWRRLAISRSSAA